ncbi:MAG TPA: S9 family peptidase, partial [Gammaproteobacteria bacterium]|nr:S9 family peptidase [Gammaproteobacteria bacterium]
MPAAKMASPGSWSSPVTGASVAAGAWRPLDVCRDGTTVYLLERRPAESGRNALVRLGRGGTAEDVLPAPFDARSRVHEYGGGAVLAKGGSIHFVNHADQRLYRLEAGSEPVALTPQGSWRYADGDLDDARGRTLWVLEEHGPGSRVQNAIAEVSLTGGHPRILVSGRDFYAYPRISPDGRFLAWITWDHPAMPWNGCELWVGELESDGSLGASQRVAGGPRESVFQPQWAPGGDLLFVSDREGWWNLHRLGKDGPEALTDPPGEMGKPLIQLGTRTFAIHPSGRVVCTFAREGRWHCGVLDPDTGDLRDLGLEYETYSALTA